MQSNQTRVKLFNNGAFAVLEKTGALWLTYARNPSGQIIDKMRCDTYTMALEYFRAFQAVAKNS